MHGYIVIGILCLFAFTQSMDTRCAAGTFLLIDRCHECPPGTYMEKENHREPFCKICSVCKRGFYVYSKCYDKGDTVCYCPPPYSIYGRYCSLIKLTVHRPQI
uniref:TNFR-Cys domain-containing protein n=1 Tax=Ranid herpesvirus 4 TaxID=2849006 RepID=A0A8F3CIN6_9VIRU|nr:MAG: hypothetical protein [Ranid herpesvirus 4]